MSERKYFTHMTMADGLEVYVKDEEARQAIQGGTYFLGITSTELIDGASTNPISINGEDVTAKNGDIVVYGTKEFIYAEIDYQWHELGDISELGALALKDEATGSFTPSGSVSFSGSAVDSTGLFTPEGHVTFHGNLMQISGFYTPNGSVSKPDVDVTPSTVNIKEMDSEGSVINGIPAELTMSYNEQTENLVFGFTPNTPTAVNLPTSKYTEVVTDVSAELHEDPSFTGTRAIVEMEGIPSGSCSFTGTESEVDVTGEVIGDLTFAGTPGTVTVS